jgi:hypothetical protein
MRFARPRVLVFGVLQASQNVKLVPDEEFFHAFHFIVKGYYAAEILLSLSRIDIDSFQVYSDDRTRSILTIEQYLFRR